MGRLNAELRSMDLNYILDMVKARDWLLGYEDRHRYDTIPSFKSTVKLLSVEINKQVKEYEKEWGIKIPQYILRRYVNAHKPKERQRADEQK